MGLQRTFNFLAETPNEAALDLLDTAMRSAQGEVRNLAIEALLQRKTAGGPQRLLESWDELSDDELRIVQAHPQTMQPVIQAILGEGREGPLWDRALNALRLLNLDELLPLIIDLLESSDNPQLTAQLLAVVIDGSTLLGNAARESRDRRSRNIVLWRLAESVRRFEEHRCEGLCEAFLAASAWGDRLLRSLLAEDVKTASTLSRLLMTSKLPAVLSLLSGFIRRPEIPLAVRQVLESREDDLFRDAILSSVSMRPSRKTLDNLRMLQQLSCWKETETLVGRTPASLHAPLLFAHTANTRESAKQLIVIVDVISRGDAALDYAVSVALEHVEPLDRVHLLQAALDVALDDSLGLRGDLYHRLIPRVIGLLDHPNRSVSTALSDLLRPVSMESYLDQFPQLSDQHRTALGSIVPRLDHQAVQTLQKALRSPIESKRVQAISATTSCNLTAPLKDLLEQLTKSEYLETRIAAISSLAATKGAKTHSSATPQASPPKPEFPIS